MEGCIYQRDTLYKIHHPPSKLIVINHFNIAVKQNLIYIYICHPSPSNSKQETTNSMSHVTVVAGLLLTLDHYQPQISLKLHIKYCTLDDKIVA